MTNHDWSDKTFIDVNSIFLDQQKKQIFENGIWEYLGDFNTIEEAYDFHVLILRAKKLARQIECSLADNDMQLNTAEFTELCLGAVMGCFLLKIKVV